MTLSGNSGVLSDCAYAATLSPICFYVEWDWTVLHRNNGTGQLPSSCLAAILWRVGRNVCNVGKNEGNEKKVQCPGHLFTRSSDLRITHGMNCLPAAKSLPQEMKKHGRPDLRSTTPSPSKDARDASMSIKRLDHGEGNIGMRIILRTSEPTDAISDARPKSLLRV